MPSQYIQPSDCEALGLDIATDPGVIQSASTIVDSYLKRPEGLVWTPDGQGMPCYMAALAPTISIALPVALVTGVATTFAYPLAASGASGLMGDVLVVDRATSTQTEALSITSVDPTLGTITLAAPVFTHAVGAMLDHGLAITEERALPGNRPITRVSNFPVARLLSGCGRYTYGRRSDRLTGPSDAAIFLTMLQPFGGPEWTFFDIRYADVSSATGEVWIPSGLMLANFSDIRLRYVSGYPASSIPFPVKRATANLINNTASNPDVTPNFRLSQAGGTRIERFSDSQIDTDTKALLDPYRLKALY